jgi:hypothetical protein
MKVYHYLEEATRTLAYAAFIKPFQRRKDGRGDWLALLEQYAGNDKWEAEIKIQLAVLHIRTWKGQSNFSLESFISQHRNAYVSMEACAEHVQYQNNDAGLQAAIASVRTDDGPTGKRNNFLAATQLLSYDPVATKRLSGDKRGSGLTSSVMDIAEDEQTHTIAYGKPAIGKTGVHIRYHKCVSKRASATTGCQLCRPELGPRRRPFFHPRQPSLWSNCSFHEWC